MIRDFFCHSLQFVFSNDLYSAFTFLVFNKKSNGRCRRGTKSLIIFYNFGIFFANSKSSRCFCLRNRKIDHQKVTKLRYILNFYVDQLMASTRARESKNKSNLYITYWIQLREYIYIYIMFVCVYINTCVMIKICLPLLLDRCSPGLSLKICSLLQKLIISIFYLQILQIYFLKNKSKDDTCLCQFLLLY